ncbi:ABC transporter substrate-binding protein [Alcanivorax sp. N3-2A]|nr:ABC transporter substrate-binding protein [Alcanivorax sp. N3-2A]
MYASCLCTPAFAEPAMTTVRLAQNLSPISGITIVAKERGIFEKHGLNVVVSNFTSGRLALEATIGGGADIATTAEAPVTAAAMAGQEIAFLTRMEYSDLKTLVTTASGIETIQDLEGKRLGLATGTGSEVYVSALLKAAGLTKGDVRLVSLKPQTMVSALAAGGVDAINIWEPHITNARKALGDQVRQIDTAGIYSETFNIVTMQPYLEKNRDTVTRFLEAMIEAEGWIKAHPDEAPVIIARAVGMNVDDLVSVWQDYIFNVVIDQRTLDVLHAHARWRLETGNAPTGATMPDFSTVIFPDVLGEIDSSRVKIAIR